MKKIVLKLEIKDEKNKRRVLKAAASVEGVDSVQVDMKEKKATVIGDVDPFFLTSKLRKFGFTELLSVGPAKEEKKEIEKKEEKKPQSDAKDKAVGQKVEYVPTRIEYRPYEYSVVSEENPKSCGIS